MPLFSAPNIFCYLHLCWSAFFFVQCFILLSKCGRLIGESLLTFCLIKIKACSQKASCHSQLTSKGKKCVTLSLIFKFKPVGFDSEQVISHQKPINSWVAKALLSLYILSKIWIFESAIMLRDYLVYSSQIFRDGSLCSTLWIVSADFLADRLEKGGDYTNKIHL